ncbi:aspartate kinase [Saccharibacillus sacchari]|uniref:Aspartokinase n=1 Tax=Saccharibacillus sacchari DSM 19268 TaxID=915437 RepID=A0A010YS97_9BACL|nr:aspartate kinase [Saccharibacillus sacchari]EXG83080.1 aspartate kinase [Saccharibacillus sacchari DSM 19268]
MAIRVQKFGGTSLSSEEARAHVVRHVQRELAAGYQLVVVVSAMGRSGDPYATDTLLGWAASTSGKSLPAKEKDLLMGCGEIISAATLCGILHQEGIDATVLTGAQAGFMTDSHFGNARILEMRPERILRELQDHSVVIVTGFQGQNEYGDLTTLGRGGSDTSATALGAALHAEIVDIYTDVNGILTADPRLVEDAKPLEVVSYTEICNMAYQGAKVIHPRAVEIAMQAQIPVRVRSTFSEEEGTLVTHPENFADVSAGVIDRFVTGIAYVNGVTQITVEQPDPSGQLSLNVFKAMAENAISVDFINVTPVGAVYTVFDSEAERALTALRGIGYEPRALNGCAKVSVIGGGINGVPGIMSHIVEALTLQNVQILQSADSNTTIWVLVKKDDMVKALKALHTRFELHR